MGEIDQIGSQGRPDIVSPFCIWCGGFGVGATSMRVQGCSAVEFDLCLGEGVRMRIAGLHVSK